MAQKIIDAEHGGHDYVKRKGGFYCRFGCGCWKQAGTGGVAWERQTNPGRFCPKNPVTIAKKKKAQKKAGPKPR